MEREFIYYIKENTFNMGFVNFELEKKKKKNSKFGLRVCGPNPLQKIKDEIGCLKL